jgi:hypothetical protein
MRRLRASDRGDDVPEHDDRKRLQIRHQRFLQRQERHLLGIYWIFWRLNKKTGHKTETYQTNILLFFDKQTLKAQDIAIFMIPLLKRHVSICFRSHVQSVASSTWVRLSKNFGNAITAIVGKSKQDPRPWENILRTGADTQAGDSR